MVATLRVSTEGGRQIETRLAKLIDAFDDLEPLLEGMGLYLESTTIERFETSTAPDGTAWKPSLRVRLEGGKTLVKSGSSGLRGSITSRASSRSVEVGTNKIYAGIHQFGGIIRPKNAKFLAFGLPGGLGLRRVKEVEMPARPFLGLSTEDESELFAQVADYSRAAMGSA